MNNNPSEISHALYTPLATSNPTPYGSITDPVSVQPEGANLEGRLPRRVSPGGLEISNVTGEEPPASSLCSCPEKLLNSVSTFFSSLSRLSSCCFEKDSFQDVTQPSDLQLKIASILRDHQTKKELLSAYSSSCTESKNFYTNQNAFLVTYLQFLQKHLGVLISRIQNKNGNEKIVAEMSPRNLIDAISKQLQYLRENKPEYESLVTEIKNRLINTQIPRDGDAEETILSAKYLSNTIVLHSRTFQEQKHTFDLQLKPTLERLCDNNQDFLVNPNDDNLAAIDSVVNAGEIHFAEEIHLLEKLSQNELNNIKERNQKTQKGFTNYMMLLQNEVQRFGDVIGGEVEKIDTQRQRARDAEAFRKSQLRGSRF